MHRAGELLCRHGKADIWAHVQAVAEEAERLAARFGLDAARCREAALCHDLGGILSPDEMLSRAQAEGWAIDPAEARYPFLLHQRFSAVLCRTALAIEDAVILSAVGCHTTLRPGAGPVDMAVYLADKLAWDQPGMPPYLEDVRAALDTSLPTACLAHMDYAMDNDMIRMPHQWFLAAQAWLRETTTPRQS